jgi:hypothetical protein
VGNLESNGAKIAPLGSVNGYRPRKWGNPRCDQVSVARAHGAQCLFRILDLTLLASIVDLKALHTAASKPSV